MALVVRPGDLARAVPGGSTAFAVQVDSREARPLNVTVEVVGAAAAWAREPAVGLYLQAGGSESARFWFDTPETPVDGPGYVPFSVRVTARQDPTLTTCVRAALQLTPFQPLTFTLDPPVAGGREEARISVAVTNHGIGPAAVSVAVAQAHDGKPRMRTRAEPAALTIDPGATAGSTVLVEARGRPRLFERHHPLGIEVIGPDGVGTLAVAEFVQKAVVPKWTLVTPILLVALLAAALLLGSNGPPNRQGPRESAPDIVIESPAGPAVTAEPPGR